MCPPPGSSDGSDGSRFGARASLWVHQLESDSEPLPAVTASSPGPARVLDVDRNSLIYIGGLGAHGQVSPAEGHACAGVRPRVISVCVCVAPASCGAALVHLPGLSGRSLPERAQRRPLELRQQGGRVWRLLQQVQVKGHRPASR